MTYLYVIAIGGDDGPFRGPCKIGLTERPEKRLAEIRPHSPLGLSFAYLHQIPDRGSAFHAEACIHSGLADRLIDHEWFDVSPEAAIEAVKAVAG